VRSLCERVFLFQNSDVGNAPLVVGRDSSRLASIPSLHQQRAVQSILSEAAAAADAFGGFGESRDVELDYNLTTRLR
jgi:hypothetical protein